MTVERKVICKEELDLDWQEEDGLLHGSKNPLEMKPMDTYSLNGAINTFCDFKKKNVPNSKKPCKNKDSSSVEHAKKSNLYNAIVVVKKLSEQFIKKSLIKKENINPKIKSTKNSKNAPLMTRFCENCKKIVKFNINRKSCCTMCKRVLDYRCKKCNKLGKSYEGLIYHLKAACQSEGHYYQCAGCPYKSAFNYKIREHMELLHKNLSVSDIKIIPSQNLMKDLRSSDPYVHKCFKCGKKFRLLIYLNRHLKACGDFKYEVALTGKNEIEIGIDKNSNSEDLLNQYDPTPDALNVTKLAKLYCKKCNKRTALNHRVYSAKKCNDCESVLLFECSKCEKQYKSDGGIVIHLKTKCAVQEMYFCSKCNYQSPLKECLNRHYRNVHESISVECPKCKTVLKNKSVLTKHLQYCEKKHIFSETCPKCEKKLKNKYTLRNHLNSCGRERDFHCSLCPFTAHRKINLAGHMSRIHLKDANKFPACPKCGLKFEYKKWANAHVRFCGSSEPHLECDYCGLKTADKIILRRHIMRHFHTVDKPDERYVDVVN